MSFGRVERQLAACAAAGGVVPALSSRVELFEDLLPVWRAFALMRRRRQSSMAALPFSPSDVASIVELCAPPDPDARLAWFRWLSALDDAELAHLRKAAPANGR